MQSFVKSYVLPLALVIALAGMLGSLYFSEVMHLPPCLWCWYQRIALYPLVLIIAVAIATRDSRAWLYALPLSLIGCVMALYHVLLIQGVFTEVAACRVGVSCATISWSWGFLTIPVLSLLAFISISVLLWVFKKYNR